MTNATTQTTQKREFWFQCELPDGRTFWTRERATSRQAGAESLNGKLAKDGLGAQIIKVQRKRPY